MIDKVIAICLIIGIMILIYPKPICETIKKFVPYGLILLFVIVLAITFDVETQRILIIQATGQSNAQASGSEIWLKQIILDGKEISLDTLGDSWIYDEGYLKWRSYDRPEGMQDQIQLNLNPEQSVQLIFDANKWRGIVTIQAGFRSKTIDCYKDTDSGELKVNLEEATSMVHIPGKILAIQITAVLVVMAVVLTIWKRIKHSNKEAIKPVIDSSNREIWLDVLKIISAFMVCLIHTVDSAYQTLPIGSAQWNIVLFLNALSRFAVPVFIMISGILILNKEISNKKMIRNVKHALLLLVVWNIAYIFLEAVLWEPGEDILKQILSLPVQRGPSGHLWYSYFLVWLYLLSPILGVMYRALTMKQRISFAFITLLLPSIIDLYGKVILNESSYVISTSIFITVNYIGLLFLGRTVYDLKDKIPHIGKLSAVMVIIGLGGMMVLSGQYAMKNGTVTDIYLLEINSFPIIYAIGVLLFGIKFSRSSYTIPSIIKNGIVYISSLSLGIYFSHCVAWWTIGDLDFGAINITQNGSATNVLCCCVVYYVVSLIWVMCMSKIPVLRKLIS